MAGSDYAMLAVSSKGRVARLGIIPASNGLFHFGKCTLNEISEKILDSRAKILEMPKDDLPGIGILEDRIKGEVWHFTFGYDPYSKASQVLAPISPRYSLYLRKWKEMIFKRRLDEDSYCVWTYKKKI